MRFSTDVMTKREMMTKRVLLSYLHSLVI